MTSRRVYLTDQEAQALEQGIKYLRLLHAIEQLHVLSPKEDAELWHLLGGVDPLELDMVANQLEAVFQRYGHSPIKIGGVQDG